MEKGDILVISTSREQLTSILSKNIGSIESFDENEDDSETKKQVIVIFLYLVQSRKLIKVLNHL